MALDAVPMDFSYGSSFKTKSAEAYERLFARRDGRRSDTLPTRGRGRALMGDRGSHPQRFRTVHPYGIGLGLRREQVGSHEIAHARGPAGFSTTVPRALMVS